MATNSKMRKRQGVVAGWTAIDGCFFYGTCTCCIYVDSEGQYLDRRGPIAGQSNSRLEDSCKLVACRSSCGQRSKHLQLSGRRKD